LRRQAPAASRWPIAGRQSGRSPLAGGR